MCILTKSSGNCHFLKSPGKFLTSSISKKKNQHPPPFPQQNRTNPPWSLQVPGEKRLKKTHKFCFFKQKRTNSKNSNTVLVDKLGREGTWHGNAILGFQVMCKQRKYSHKMQLNLPSLYTALLSFIFIMFQPTVTKTLHSCLPVLLNCKLKC